MTLRWVMVTVAALALAAPASADPPVDPAGLLAGVNARRAADGMPALVGDAAMDQGCLNHVNYGLLNGNGLGFPDDPHNEIPGKPGYTELGQKAAGRSVLGYGLLNGGKPFFHSPGHLFHFLSPFPLKAGVAERTEGTFTLGCAWFANADADDVEQRRPASDPPRQWSVPYDGQTGVPIYEAHFDAPPTNYFEAGFTTDPGGPVLGGPVLQLYQEDVGTTRLDDLCQSVLLAPGRQPVTATPLRRGQLVVKDPLIASAVYTQVSTFTNEPGCQGAVSRTGSASFTTAAPRRADDVLSIGDPFQDTDGHWKVKVGVGDELSFFTRGNGSILLTFDMGDPQYYGTYRDAFWQQGGMTLTLDYGPVGQTLTVQAIPDALAFGATCYGPQRGVKRVFTHTASGIAAATAQTVVASGTDPCTAAPDVTSRSPAAGGPGTEVRLTGTALTGATRVRFGGGDATRWRADGADLIVTVPNAASDGPIRVDTPYGTDSSDAFDVTADDVAPVTPLLAGPSGSAGPTATFVFDLEPGSTAACSLDGGAPAPCASPVTYDGLGTGPHTFAVRATDPAGNTQAAPTSRGWTVGLPSADVDGPPPPQDSTPAAAPTTTPATAQPTTPTMAPAARPPREVVLLRSGSLRLVRELRRNGRRVTLGTLRADRSARAELTVHAGRRRLLRLARRLRAGQAVPVVVTLPKAQARRGSVTLTVRLGRARAKVVVRR